MCRDGDASPHSSEEHRLNDCVQVKVHAETDCPSGRSDRYSRVLSALQ